MLRSVTGVDDVLQDGNQVYLIITAAATAISARAPKMIISNPGKAHLALTSNE